MSSIRTKNKDININFYDCLVCGFSSIGSEIESCIICGATENNKEEIKNNGDGNKINSRTKESK